MNNKQTVFVAEYLKDFNASRAAKAAGYSAKTARKIGSENLTKPDIQEAIKAEITERSMGKDEVLTRLADIARGDIADLLDIHSTGYSIALMVRDENGELIVNPKTKLIKKIKQKVTTIMPRNETGDEKEIVETEIELYSAHDALRDLGKFHALFVDRQEVTGANGEPIRFVEVVLPPEDTGDGEN